MKYVGNLKNSVLKYFIIALLFSSVTNFVNAIPAFPINTTTCKSIVNNLGTENTYEVCVKGIFSEGDGPWSNGVTITTPAKPIIAFDAGNLVNRNFAKNVRHQNF